MFTHYLRLQSKMDTLCRSLEQQHDKHLRCKEGCSSCCRFSLTFSAVEILHIAVRLLEGDRSHRDTVLAALAAADPDAEGPCPLLVNDRCTAYEHRPLLCRSHGLAFVTREEENGPLLRLSGCELNYTNADFTSFQDNEFLNLDTLNLLLTKVNQAFLQDFPAELPPRLTLHDLPELIDFLSDNPSLVSEDEKT